MPGNIHKKEKRTMEDTYPEQGDFTPDAPDERQMAIDEAMADPAYLDEHHPLHKNQVAKVQAMFQEKYPEDHPAVDSRDELPPPPEEKVSPLTGIEMPEMPQGHQWDEAALKSFIPIAKELGMSDEELQTELEVFVAGASRFDPISYSEDEGIAALNERLGQSAGSIVKLAQEYINGLPDQTRAKLVNWLETTQLGNHPRIIETLARRGKKISTA
jgi:hypothetical protein